MSSHSNRLRNDLSNSAGSQLTKYHKVSQKKIISLAFMVATFSNLSRFYTMTIKRCFVTYLCVRHGILLFFWAGILTDPHKQASICLDEEDFKKKKLKLQQFLLFSVALLFSQTFEPSRRQENPLLRMRWVKLTWICTWNVFLSLWGPFVLHSRRLYSPKTPLIRLTRTKRFWWQFSTQLWRWVSFSFLVFFMTMRKLWLLLLMIVFSDINGLVIKKKNISFPSITS